jgi:hypothetical protein
VACCSGPVRSTFTAVSLSVHESVEIAAPADLVYGLVSDVTRMGEWSPETQACQWKSGATGPQVGARFSGNNRNGKHAWSTTCEVIAADPGRLFAYRVSYLGMAIAEWSYELRPTANGCELTETTIDRRRLPMKVIGGVGTGVNDRETHNRAGIIKTLAAIKTHAESAV